MILGTSRDAVSAPVVEGIQPFLMSSFHPELLLQLEVTL